MVDILQNHPYVTVEKIMYLLENIGLEWVADELYAELLLERGKLPIEEYIQEESEILISRLLDEDIGKERVHEISKIVASSRQVAKEAWKRQMVRKSKAAAQEVKMIQEDIITLYKDIDHFLSKKEGLNGREFDTATSEIDFVNPQNSRQCNIRMLSEKVRLLSQCLDQIIEEHQKLVEERGACYELLGYSPDDGSLEEVLKGTLRRASNELGRQINEVTDKGHLAVSLEDQIRQLRKAMGTQISFKNVEIEQMQRAARQREDEIKKVKKILNTTNHEKDIMGAQVEYWKQRCEVLEKTKRLGYYYLSWYDNVKGRKSEPGLDSSKGKMYYDPETMYFSKNGKITLRDGFKGLPPLDEKVAVAAKGNVNGLEPMKKSESQPALGKVSILNKTTKSSKPGVLNTSLGLSSGLSGSRGTSEWRKGSGRSIATESSISLDSLNGAEPSHCRCCPRCCVEAPSHTFSA